MRSHPMWKRLFPYAITAGILAVFGIAKVLTVPLFGLDTPFLFNFTPVLLVSWFCNRWAAAATVFTLTAFVPYEFTGTIHPSMTALHTIQSFVFLAEGMFLVFIITHARTLVAQKEASRCDLSTRLKDYKDLCNAIPHLIWWSDQDANCLLLNERWHSMTGVTTNELLGMGWKQVVHPDDLKILLPSFLVKFSDPNPKPFEYEIRLRRQDGEYRWFMGRAVPLLSTDGDLLEWVGTCTDIHRSKLCMDRLAVADQLKDDFLATLAHELRNPLAPVFNCIAVLNKQATGANPTIVRMLGIIDRQVRQMSNLVEDILDISRISRGKLAINYAVHDLNSDLLAAVEAIRPVVESKTQHLKPGIPAAPILVNGDRTRLIQVFSNILTNSSRYTDKDGVIWINVTVAGREVHVSIRDTGIGISADMLPKIFNLYTQEERYTKTSEGGLGIGLSLVKKLVDAHGGRVKAQSDGLGQGTTITVSLPLAAQEEIIHATLKPPTSDDFASPVGMV